MKKIRYNLCWSKENGMNIVTFLFAFISVRHEPHKQFFFLFYFFFLATLFDSTFIVMMTGVLKNEHCVNLKPPHLYSYIST